MFLLISLLFFSSASLKINYNNDNNNLKLGSSNLKNYFLQKPQILNFIEPSTNIEVILIGSMHYNPISIKLAESVIKNLGENNLLASVVIESCPIRWNKTLEIQETASIFLRTLLKNEMLAAYEVAKQYNSSVILGDQCINITNTKISNSAKEGIIDLLTPFNGGWKRLWSQISFAASNSLPTGSSYLGFSDIFDPKLLLLSPVSLLRYPLALIIKSPKFGLPALLSLLLITFSKSTTTIDENLLNVSLIDHFIEFFSSLVFVSIEFIFLSKIFLITILNDRNYILAENILNECKLQADLNSRFIFKNSDNNDDSNIDDKNEKFLINNKINKNKMVVAVLGMAHCNGIKKILLEKK